MPKLEISLTKRELRRLAGGDWRISVGRGVKVPNDLQAARAKIRWAAINAASPDTRLPEEGR